MGTLTETPAESRSKPYTAAASYEMVQHMDDRGFAKAELVMFNPAAPNIQTGVNLVARDTCPNGYQLVDADRSGKKSQFDLVELAAQVEKADQFTRATAGSKLTVIAEQVRFLQEQARKVLEEARMNALLHKTSCNFKKIPGKTYYVYKQRKNPDDEFLSMISPEEWGSSGPEFVAGYRLEYDMSWTELKVGLYTYSLSCVIHLIVLLRIWTNGVMKSVSSIKFWTQMLQTSSLNFSHLNTRLTR